MYPLTDFIVVQVQFAVIVIVRRYILFAGKKYNSYCTFYELLYLYLVEILSYKELIEVRNFLSILCNMPLDRML